MIIKFTHVFNMCYSAFFAPAKYTRILLMEFGLEGLITKLEEYIGKKATLFVMYGLLLWLFTVVSRAIIEWSIWIFDLITKWELIGFEDLSTWEIIVFIVDTGFFVLLLMFFIPLFFLHRKVKKVVKSSEKMRKSYSQDDTHTK